MIELFQKIKNNKKLYATRIYLTALGIYMFTLVIAESAYVTRHEAGKLGLILKAIQLLATALCCVRLLIAPPCFRRESESMGSKIDIKRMIILGLGFLAFLFCAYNSGYMQSLLVPFFLLGAVDLDSKPIVKTAIAVEGGILALLLILSQLGLTEDYVFENAGRIRHALGTNWCTVPIISFYFIMLGYIYIRAERFKWYEAVVLELMNLYLFYMTRTRMTFVVATAFLAFFAIQSLWKEPWKIFSKLKWFWVSCPFILAGISLVAIVAYRPESEIWVKINKLFSNRFVLSQSALSDYKITLFGQDITWNGHYILSPTSSAEHPYNYVDCSYLQYLLSYGVVFLIIILALYSWGIYKCIKANNYWGVFVLLLVLVHSMTEPHLMNIKVNPLLLAAMAIPCANARNGV
ncbi:MAG: hypothetical protein E7282_02065 [Lachnospiraceae bacterium]|nr:hypothetical protein [Lachnospiraceae bacterium]